MIVLDTNVVSEAMKPEPSLAARDGFDKQAVETFYISSVTVAKLLFGIDAPPDSRRKQKLVAALDGMLRLFEGRTLTFDTDTACHYADIAVATRKAGKGFPVTDGYIATIATAYGFAVATSDASAFDAAGVPIIDC
ncbi:type II toxin-antitoxin system VapC family toxin [Martelella mangrovi]|uniref:Ribonuclease VapC n=1 Tax=Martelella mangrovi TaxID=1397477 RepID=A0ABV2IEK6_9HYPH